MRCDTQVYFVTNGEKRMVTDPASANYGRYAAEASTEVMAFADVTDTKTETQRLLFGEIREGSVTVRLNGHAPAAFDHIRIQDATGASKLYDVDASRRLRHRHAFICHEVK